MWGGASLERQEEAALPQIDGAPVPVLPAASAVVPLLFSEPLLHLPGFREKRGFRQAFVAGRRQKRLC